MTLSIIIVNYNVKAFLEQCLLSVRKAIQGMDAEVIVVDNNSVDGSVAMLENDFPEVVLIKEKKNHGFSIANNLAIRQSKGKYILLLNPDTLVQEDTFSASIAKMDSDPTIGCLGVKMLDGSGKFLPESKRGFPSPSVAFFKIIGLTKLFPNSKYINGYHLGYLDKDESHEVDVLCGAFMMMPKTVLDKVGLLDEAFFMYGEDIDLSYRIIKAGYKNVYFPETQIIHFKGESTKKGSLNYVKTFYQAMSIFASKHLDPGNASRMNGILNVAIYGRAMLSMVKSFFQNYILYFTDILLMVASLIGFKNFWESFYFGKEDYYSDIFEKVNVPLYVVVWLIALYYSGAYDKKVNLWKTIRAMLLGTLVLLALYGLFPEALRNSRMIILLGSILATGLLISSRWILNKLFPHVAYLQNNQLKKSLVVGSATDYQQILSLLSKTAANTKILGRVAVLMNGQESQKLDKTILSGIDNLEEISSIHKPDEIIFAAKSTPMDKILFWMSKLGPKIAYKITGEESLSIVGSKSKNQKGELYSVALSYNIASRHNRRLKRLIDILASTLFVILSPVLIFLPKNGFSFIKNCFLVLFGSKTWVSYESDGTNSDLPVLRSGVLHPAIQYGADIIHADMKEKINFIYAKDYQVNDDLVILKSHLGKLGSK